ncbi:methyltransferase TRM13 domain-containing protein [Phthorimaea operculella]|nr:methyltransferase TRM13 domain-containing protein [Phthorimaea operculella]
MSLFRGAQEAAVSNDGASRPGLLRGTRTKAENRRWTGNVIHHQGFQLAAVPAGRVGVHLGRLGDTRIPCPYDPKHTVYKSKLEKHLSICNAKQTEFPPYIVQNINAPTEVETCLRRPLSEIPKDTLMRVIDKVNSLYEKHIEGKISEVPEQPIHAAILEEFCEGDRMETSRRHMRQASSILHLAEKSGLVNDRTCYVELGAGKGQLSYYMGTAWCDELTASSVVVIDRAALRHKRDNKLRTAVERIRADLAHLVLAKVERIAEATAVVGFAKHLCGVATDFALRCVTADSILPQTRGIVLATCCHHRCEHAQYIAHKHLQELGISGDDFNAMLGVVSWATCGDGRSRECRKQINQQNGINNEMNQEIIGENVDQNGDSESNINNKINQDVIRENVNRNGDSQRNINNEINQEIIGENVDRNGDSQNNINNQINQETIGENVDHNGDSTKEINANSKPDQENDNRNTNQGPEEPKRNIGDAKWREEIGRRAKAFLDWGRVLYLREKGFETNLCYYVPSSVSLENVCIVATKR